MRTCVRFPNLAPYQTKVSDPARLSAELKRTPERDQCRCKLELNFYTNINVNWARWADAGGLVLSLRAEGGNMGGKLYVPVVFSPGGRSSLCYR